MKHSNYPPKFSFLRGDSHLIYTLLLHHQPSHTPHLPNCVRSSHHVVVHRSICRNRWLLKVVDAGSAAGNPDKTRRKFKKGDRTPRMDSQGRRNLGSDFDGTTVYIASKNNISKSMVRCIYRTLNHFQL
ncbi:uncharacterized protein LOC121749578 [Salvia splendens]|uniref:uncharacterized protein LOC121749578 n=1 Tax=Salvia splendens TaxID=180675 RepID=UPI001C26A802|nr:uncharacterized protein LOC121749578 [Salvia splendens]